MNPLIVLLLSFLIGSRVQDSIRIPMPNKYVTITINPITEHLGLALEGTYSCKSGKTTVFRQFNEKGAVKFEFPAGSAGFLLLHAKAGSGVITMKHNLDEGEREETHYIFEDDIMGLRFLPFGSRTAVSSMDRGRHPMSGYPALSFSSLRTPR